MFPGQLNEHKDMLNGDKGTLSHQSVPVPFTLFTSETVSQSQTSKEHNIYPEYNMWVNQTKFDPPEVTQSLLVNEIHKNLFRNGWDPRFTIESGSISDSSLSTASSVSTTPSSLAPSLTSTPIYTPSYTPSSSPDLSLSDDYDDSLPRMESIIPHRRLDIPPSCFTNGCICGHNFEFRDMVYETRKRRVARSSGVTIKPKTQPIEVKLKYKI